MRYFQIRYVFLGLAIAIVLYFVAIPMRLADVKHRVPEPQAIFVLGGGKDREKSAALIAQQQPQLEVWVSTGSDAKKIANIFQTVGVSLDRLHLDYRAVDTVTNFTTMVGVFQQQGIKHVYLLTSDFHMRRARAITFFVFGSRGIAYTPIEIADNSNELRLRHLAESPLHIFRDVVRSIVWLLTKRTGGPVRIRIPRSL